MHHSPPHPFGKRQAVFALIYILLGSFLLFSFSVNDLMLILPIPGLAMLALARPDPRQWLLAMPLAISLGYAEVFIGPYPVILGTVFTGMSYMIYFMSKAATLEPVPRIRLFSGLLVAAYAAQVVSIFISVYIHEQHAINAVREGHKFFFPALLVLIITDWYSTRKSFDAMLRALVVTLLVMTLYGNYQFYSGLAYSTGEVAAGYDIVGRVYSTIRGGANSYSGYLELMVPTALAAGFHFKAKGWRLAAWLAAGLGFQNGLLTYSRGAFLTIFLSCLAYLAYRFRRMAWIPVVLVVILTGIILVNAERFERQLNVFTDPRAVAMESTILHRYVIYAGFIRDIRENPVTGVGWGAREFFSSGSSLYSFWEVRHERSIHDIPWFGGLNSLFFDMALKGGIASVLSLALIIASVVAASARALKSLGTGDISIGIISGMAGFGVHQLVDNLLQWPQTGAVFWIMLGLLGALGGKGWRGRPIDGNHGFEVVEGVSPETVEGER